MDARITALAEILRLNTRLFRNCLDGFTDEMAGRRPSGGTNSAAFIASHLTDARFYLLKLLGAEQPNPVAASLAGARSIDDVKQLLPLPEIQAAWTTAAHALRDCLESITTADLDAKTSTRFPMPDPTILGVLTFLVQHDTYHIGQLALLRKHAGLPAMRYT
jgi:uncharacterized damage-inducible protein DinB